MTTVETVRGTVALDTLSVTLMHEHVFAFTTTADVLDSFDQRPTDEDALVSDALAKLLALKKEGVNTLVDPTVLGLGRNLRRLQRVNAGVDINIIVATGLYTLNTLPYYFSYRGPGTMLGGPELLTELFIRDVREGIAGTGVKAAFLKCAVDAEGYTHDLIRLHGSICDVHRETGVPIMVHTHGPTQTGRLVLDFYSKQGVDLSSVLVAHAGDSNDLDYLREIMDQGAIIGCDRFGMDPINTTENRVKNVATLCAEGYADRIVLSHDTACFIDFLADPKAQERIHEVMPDWNYLHVTRNVLPALRRRGVTDEQIKMMMVGNPMRYFSH